MANTLGIDAKKSEVFGVNPFEITMTEDNRGRSPAPTEKDIINLATSIFDHGQQQATVVRKNADGTIQQVSGFTRNAAVRLIRTGFTGMDGQERKDEEFRLLVSVQDVDDETALVNNIVENIARNDLSPIQHANNQQKLRDKYSKTDADIARLYQWDQSVVCRHRKLLELDDSTKFLVHTGSMSMNAALDVVGLNVKDRKAVIQAATDDKTGQVKSDKIKGAIRNRALAAAEEKGQEEIAPVKKGGKKKATKASTNGDIKNVEPIAETPPAPVATKRSLKDLKDYLSDTKDATNIPDLAKTFLGKLEVWLEGRNTDKVLTNALLKLAGVDK